MNLQSTCNQLAINLQLLERQNGKERRMTDYISELLKLIKENPTLPIVPMVDEEICGDDSCRYWMGKWGRSAVSEIYLGREHVHFIGDDEEDVLGDLTGCNYYCDPSGKDITELTDDEWKELYDSVPWEKCIVVYITI